MNWLPVVSRELRVAARKRSTFWLRVAAAVTGLLIGGGCLVISAWKGIPMTTVGDTLFGILVWLCLVAGLCAGLFFTSDCLSEEKREGTLGLLFLTELRGYDVTLGKLAATSLRGVYALLALLPILAITQLMGGVTGAQYWKSALALCNGLFFSLAAGMFVSALSRDSQKALGGTLLMLLLLVIGGLVADGSIADIKGRPFQPFWCLCSPAYVLVCANAWGRTAYWSTLLVTQLVAWAMLATACLVLPHTWQERKRLNKGGRRGWFYAWKYGGPRRRLRLRRRLLERYPTAWLVCRERWQAVVFWVAALLAAGGFISAFIWTKEQAAWIFFNYLGKLFVLLLYLWTASQACRFLVEARRSGLLELLLATPLDERKIIRGQWRAWLGMFAVPVLLLLSADAGSAVLSQLSFQRLATQANATAAAMAATNTAVATSPNASSQVNVSSGQSHVTVSVNFPTGTNTNRGAKARPARAVFRLSSSTQQIAITSATALLVVLAAVGNLLALCWFGLWMGMTSRTANLATLRTILFVQILPWFVITFGAAILSVSGMAFAYRSGSSLQPGDWLLWWPLLSAALGTTVTLAKDLGFILYARRKLRSSLRERAAHHPGEARFAAPPPLPKPVPAPPILPAPA